MSIKRLIKNELSGWKVWEIAWILFACFAIAGLSICWGDTLMGIISATTGVACVVCTGKGKLSAYLFGVVNCVLYAIISYNAKYYGETALNAIYYVPCQFIGFFVWLKHINDETHEVRKRHMTWKIRGLSVLGVAIGTVVGGFGLKFLDGSMPFVDSFTTVASIVAMIISIGMYAEQWWLWIGVDVFTVILWSVDFIHGTESISTLMMWIVYLLNAIIMCIKWEKEIADNKLIDKE